MGVFPSLCGRDERGKKNFHFLFQFRLLFVVWMIETERKKEMGDGERKAKTPQRRIEGEMFVARSSKNKKVGFSGVFNFDVPSREVGEG